MLGLAILCALGTELDVAGKRYAWLPWSVMTHLPGFDKVIPTRFSLYAALATAVIAALWAAMTGPPAAARALLTITAIALIVPHVGLSTAWHTHPERPPFFERGMYRHCFDATDNVLMLPIPAQGDSMLWQAEAHYSFRMADGYLTAAPPMGIPDWGHMANFFVGAKLANARSLIDWAHAAGVTRILVDGTRRDGWLRLLAPIGPPKRIGGVYLYTLQHQKTLRCSASAGS